MNLYRVFLSQISVPISVRARPLNLSRNIWSKEQQIDLNVQTQTPTHTYTPAVFSFHLYRMSVDMAAEKKQPELCRIRLQKYISLGVLVDITMSWEQCLNLRIHKCGFMKGTSSTAVKCFRVRLTAADGGFTTVHWAFHCQVFYCMLYLAGCCRLVV